MMTRLRSVYVGIDVHKKTHTVAFLPSSAGELPSHPPRMTFLQIGNDRQSFQAVKAELEKYVDDPSKAAVAIDCTGGHSGWALVYFLHANGYATFNVEPTGMKQARERLLAQENKSDSIDAAAAAYLLYLRDCHWRSFRISAVPYEMGSSASILGELVRIRDQHSRRLVQVTNRLRQLLVAVFPEGEALASQAILRVSALYPTPRDIIESEGLSGIKRIRRTDRDAICNLARDTVGVPAEDYREVIRYLAEQRDQERRHCRFVARLIEKRIRAHQYGEILLSFPGVGVITAAAVISVVKDISRWPGDRQLRKAFGVYSTMKESGVGPGKGRMGKGGSRETRRLLFQAVLSSLKMSAGDNDIRDYYLRQISKGKPTYKAFAATMGKLAEIIYHCLKQGEPYEYRGTYRL